MEELKEQISSTQKNKGADKLNSDNKRQNPGLRALLSIKHFAASVESDYTELIKIEIELKQLNEKAVIILEASISLDESTNWKLLLPEIDKATKEINAILIEAKEKAANQAKDYNPELWNQLNARLHELKQYSQNAVNKGLTILPASVHLTWNNDFVNLQLPLLESLISRVESCRILLQMIERYTPDELNAITQIIADHVPLDFTYEEALVYQTDYYKALINFKKEFQQEKNLWDKFLDILAGGTHQSPSERVMMERWLDGEKGDL